MPGNILRTILVLSGIGAIVFAAAFFTGIHDRFWPVSIATVIGLTYFFAKFFPWRNLQTNVWIASFCLALPTIGVRYATEKGVSTVIELLLAVGCAIPFMMWLVFSVRQRRQQHGG